MGIITRAGVLVATALGLVLVCSSAADAVEAVFEPTAKHALGQRTGPPSLPQGPDDPGQVRPAPERPAQPLEGTPLMLGGMFIGNIELHRQKPLPNSAPTHEEMRAVTTPPEFRTPPAVTFGWSWKGRR